MDFWEALVRIATAIFIGLWVATGLGGSETTANTPQIRVSNTTDVDFQKVIVTFPEQQEEYGELRAGETSAYHSVTLAYQYAEITFTVNGQKYEIVPFDFQGEAPIEPGYYTYAIGIDEQTGQVEFEFIPELGEE